MRNRDTLRHMDVLDVKGLQCVCHNIYITHCSVCVSGKQLIMTIWCNEIMHEGYVLNAFIRALLDHIAHFECVVYLIPKSKRTCCLQSLAFNQVFWGKPPFSVVLWGFCCGLSACFRLGEGADTKYCCPVVESQTMGALSVASLFVFCHVMLHVFGTCLTNWLTEQLLVLVSQVKTAYAQQCPCINATAYVHLDVV